MKEIKSMNKSRVTPVVIVVVIVVALFLLFGGGAMMKTVMGSGTMGGITWMWFPTLVTFLLGVLVGWLLFRKRTDAGQ